MTDKLTEIICKMLGVEESAVTPDARFEDDLGADSLDAMELIMSVEEGFNFDIPDDKIPQIKTVQDLMDLVKPNEWADRDAALKKIHHGIAKLIYNVLDDVDFQREIWLDLAASFKIAKYPSKHIQVSPFTITAKPQPHVVDANAIPKTVHGHFSLSYASFLVLPRVLMQQMPEKWQNDFVTLLEEFDKEFPNQPVDGFQVRATESGKLIKMPSALCKYKYPEHDEIKKMRATP